MQNNLLGSDTKWAKNLGLIGLCLVAISLPWSIKVNSISIILLLVITLYYIKMGELKNRLNLETTVMLLLFVFYFVLHIMAIFYTSSAQAGAQALEKRLAFLVIPICVVTLLRGRMSKEVILKFFLFSILLATFVCLVISVKNNVEENLINNLPIFSPNKWFYTYRLLSYTIGIHPAYLSFFASIGIIYLLKRTILQEKFRVNVECLALTYLLIFIVLLSSRNLMITCFGIVGCTFMYAIWKYRNWQLLLFCLGIIIISTAFLFLNDVALDRLVAVLDLGGGYSNWGNLSLRLQEWEASLILIRDNFWFGVSPADVTTELVKVYQSRGWEQLAKESFNSHNQYLQTFLGLGIVGLSVLVAIIFLLFRKALLTKDFIYINFLILFAVFSMTESTLEVQKGIVSFVLLSSIFYYSATQSKPENE